jgi:hypothetical protein
MDKADLDYEAIEAQANDTVQQPSLMFFHPMDKAGLDCEAIEAQANGHA